MYWCGRVCWCTGVGGCAGVEGSAHECAVVVGCVGVG